MPNSINFLIANKSRVLKELLRKGLVVIGNNILQVQVFGSLKIIATFGLLNAGNSSEDNIGYILSIIIILNIVIIVLKTNTVKKNLQAILLITILGVWLIYSSYNMEKKNWVINVTDSLFSYTLILDGLSLLFLVLTIFLITIIMSLGYVNVRFRLREYYFYFLVLQLFLLNFFLINNLVFLYIYFEGVLIPMFLIILIGGSRKRKIHASLMFFFFTFIGSLIMLIGINSLIGTLESVDMEYLKNNIHLISKEQKVLGFMFFIAFAVKIPMYPFHTGLPEAHVEAPTGGSIILAGVLLKLGIYGLLRIILPLLPVGSEVFSGIVGVLGFISLIYISLIIMQNTDLKKIIAYSSIAHMNFAVLGLFVFNNFGVQGAIFTLLSHGIISSMLFLCIGILYERYGERNLLYYTNIGQLMPLFSVFFFFAIIGNLGVPGMSSFIGEFLLLLSLSYTSYILMFVLSLSLFLTMIYSIGLYNRIIFGFIITKNIRKYKDLIRVEGIIVLILSIVMVIFGINPQVIFNVTLEYILDFTEYTELRNMREESIINLEDSFMGDNKFRGKKV